MNAMIFAAGLGTRLRPITDTLPKALVPVCGRPLIEHVTSRLVDAGFDMAVVNVHHLADKVEAWVNAQDLMTMKVSDERECLLETGGGILHARKFLEGGGQFLVHNVDILSNADLGGLCSSARPDALATLLVSSRRSSRRLLFEPGTMRLCGWMNETTGQVSSPYAGLDPGKCLKYAFSGIHLLSDDVFEAMDAYVAYETSGSERFPIMDFYLWALGRYEIYGVVDENLSLVDVGKLDTLDKAEQFLKDKI